MEITSQHTLSENFPQISYTGYNGNYVALGDLLVIELATAPKVRGFKPGRGQWILKAIKIRGMTLFGGELKLVVPCYILQHVKDAYTVKEILVGKFKDISCQKSPALLLGVSFGYCQREL
jgi:hypothetical protein